MVSLKQRLKAVIMLLRPPYWLMTAGLSVLTMFTLLKSVPEFGTLGLVVLSAICIKLSLVGKISAIPGRGGAN